VLDIAEIAPVEQPRHEVLIPSVGEPLDRMLSNVGRGFIAPVSHLRESAVGEWSLDYHWYLLLEFFRDLLMEFRPFLLFQFLFDEAPHLYERRNRGLAPILYLDNVPAELSSQGASDFAFRYVEKGVFERLFEGASRKPLPTIREGELSTCRCRGVNRIFLGQLDEIGPFLQLREDLLGLCSRPDQYVPGFDLFRRFELISVALEVGLEFVLTDKLDLGKLSTKIFPCQILSLGVL